jgi:hypothetical protein
MRLLTAISIASLVVSIAAVVFVLGLYAELKSTHPMGHSKIGITVKEKSEPETPLVKKEHAQELNENIVGFMIWNHATELIASAGITEKNFEEKQEVYTGLPGYRCFWEDDFSSGSSKGAKVYAKVIDPSPIMTYNYVKEDDVWLLTSYGFGCGKEVKTWTVDDNTGEITYGRPGD